MHLSLSLCHGSKSAYCVSLQYWICLANEILPNSTVFHMRSHTSLQRNQTKIKIHYCSFLVCLSSSRRNRILVLHHPVSLLVPCLQLCNHWRNCFICRSLPVFHSCLCWTSNVSVLELTQRSLICRTILSVGYFQNLCAVCCMSILRYIYYENLSRYKARIRSLSLMGIIR